MRDMARQVPQKILDGARMTRPEDPPRVRAWVVDGRGQDVEVDGEAIAWTPRAVRIRYQDSHGREGWAWVWASAVTRH